MNSRFLLILSIFLIFSCGDPRGCTEETACNYNEDAINDDGSCLYPEGFCDCDGNPTNDFCDCENNSAIHECWNGDIVCDESDCSLNVEEYFSFEISSIQMDYYFQHVTVDEIQIESVDWIGAFHNDTCIGALEWGDCVGDGDWCPVKVMGYNTLNELTQDYIHDGDYPSFMIYDASSDQYFDAAPSREVPFTGGTYEQIDSLSAFSN